MLFSLSRIFAFIASFSGVESLRCDIWWNKIGSLDICIYATDPNFNYKTCEKFSRKQINGKFTYTTYRILLIDGVYGVWCVVYGCMYVSTPYKLELTKMKISSKNSFLRAHTKKRKIHITHSHTHTTQTYDSIIEWTRDLRKKRNERKKVGTNVNDWRK